MDTQTWLEARDYTPEKLEAARLVLEEIRQGREVWQAMRRYPLPGGGYLAKHILVAAYRRLVESGEWQPDPALLAHIRMKPVRTLSGVTTVTVLTRPYPCPGKCIFCPTDVRMPKSYLPDEPGARRGLQHQFDPFEQVASRIEALEAVGHPTDKIELLILGGTWSSYRRDYQEWFIRRCFDAMNGHDSTCLEDAHHLNEDSEHRNVGLVIETRPDEITPNELLWLRRLGVTKVQMGAQSLDDRILALNQRGHTTAETLAATAKLRAAGFKVVLHWMPNLLGATLESDREDFARLWNDGYAPDEIKIYPCQLLANADLFAYWQRGEYTPYTQEELVDLIADIKPGIPPYCRVNRVIRDIPSTNVVAGNKRTSLRQDVQEELARRGQKCGCIRCHEVRGQAVQLATLRLDDYVYHPADAEEHFLHFRTPEGQIAGYLRLSLRSQSINREIDVKSAGFVLHPETALVDLADAALIREIHVYGQSLPVGEEQPGAAQHVGLGTALIRAAEEIAHQRGFSRLAVIAAVGTRSYYLARGFERGELYLVKSLVKEETA
ncbi:MAG TPA: tRNA uridine(34) 5-carboxymethylaminomethyl modification radical SAM/GNAT enzyme Elp3 [Anaerolineaceae bacterium]|nr:tRNA uridine(34) 5-carboxymethylaminomethyl modification radical SAM/GNAT enzyme Elp3 [Anaerolineaceae bacterium]